MKVLLLRHTLALCVLLLPALRSAMAETTILHAGHVIDGLSNQIRDNLTLVIEDGRIVSIEEGFATPAAGAKVIDLKDQYVLPGLIDMHVHLSSQTEKGSYIKRFQQYPADTALAATRYLRATLMSGFTSVRDLGGNEHVPHALKTAVERGDIVGPRMFIATKSLAVLGGHGDSTNSYREDILPIPGTEEGIVNGVESARRAALLAIKRGADVIKITSTAGVLSLAGQGQTPQFREEEIRMIVETAQDFGLKVAAHAHGVEGMKRAIKAGVASIEHGTFMDEDVMRLMKEHEVYWVPTIIAGRTVAELAKIEGYYHPLVVPKALAIGPRIQDTFKKAYQAGVPIAFGTDAGVFPHGENAREFQYMVEGGMPPLEAIRSATYHAANLLGRLEDLGTLEQGKIADIVAVGSNPEADITALQRPTFVMKDGIVYKNRAVEPPL